MGHVQCTKFLPLHQEINLKRNKKSVITVNIDFSKYFLTREIFNTTVVIIIIKIFFKEVTFSFNVIKKQHF